MRAPEPERFTAGWLTGLARAFLGITQEDFARRQKEAIQALLDRAYGMQAKPTRKQIRRLTRMAWEKYLDTKTGGQP